MAEPVRFDFIEFPILHLDEALVRAGRYLPWVTAEEVKASFPYWVESFYHAITFYYLSNYQYHYELLESQMRHKSDHFDKNEVAVGRSNHHKFVEEMHTMYQSYVREYCPHFKTSFNIGEAGEKIRLIWNLNLSPEFFYEVWFDFVINNSPEEQAELKALSYTKYLKSSHWRRVRTAALIAYNRMCADSSCGYQESGEPASDLWMQELHVHHWNYESRGNERFKDIVVLCKGHHKIAHKTEGRENYDCSLWPPLVRGSRARDFKL